MKILTPPQKQKLRAFRAQAQEHFGPPAKFELSVNKVGGNVVLNSMSHGTVPCSYPLFEDFLLATQDANPNEHPFLMTAFKDETLQFSWADLDTTLDILVGIKNKIAIFFNGPSTTPRLPKL